MPSSANKRGSSRNSDEPRRQNSTTARSNKKYQKRSHYDENAATMDWKEMYQGILNTGSRTVDHLFHSAMFRRGVDLQQVLLQQVWPAISNTDNGDESAGSSSKNACYFSAVLISMLYSNCNSNSNSSVSYETLEFMFSRDKNDKNGKSPKDNRFKNFCNVIFCTNANEHEHEQHLLPSSIRIESSIRCFNVLWNYMNHHCIPFVPKRTSSITTIENSGVFVVLQKQLLQKHVLNIYKHIPSKRMYELYCKLQHFDLDGKMKSSSSFIVMILQHVLQLVENRNTNSDDEDVNTTMNGDDDQTASDDDDDNEENGNNEAENADMAIDDADSKSQQQHSSSKWKIIHCALELFSDLLCTTISNDEKNCDSSIHCQHIIAYLYSIHFFIRCRQCIHATSNSSGTTTHQLLQQVMRYCNTTAQQQSTDSSSSIVQHNRARIFQKLCHKYYPKDLSDMRFTGAGLLCTKPTTSSKSTTSFLRQSLSGLKYPQLYDLLHRMRLVDTDSDSTTSNSDSARTREFLLEVLEEYLVVPTNLIDELKSYPLYPTEELLWDFSRVPSSSSYVSSANSSVLSIPKLQTRYLSFLDYLWRNFELSRLETAYEIRSELVDVIRRLRPVVQYINNNNDTGGLGKTNFSGWARMGIRMDEKLEMKKVSKPLLGSLYPSQVEAEIAINLGPYGENVRQEWDELREFDSVFLIAVDATRMSGAPAPVTNQHHNINKQSRDSTRGDESNLPTRRVADEDDVTFPHRFGITLVRGCMIMQIRDENGNIHSDPSDEGTASAADAKKNGSTKRIYRVAMDATQFAFDRDNTARGGTDMYDAFNVVVRRPGKTNNFRSVLDTIRGLIVGSGSIDKVIPKWLQPVLLGQGNPSDVIFSSPTMTQFATATAGVADPSKSFLDYGDSFLSERHMRESFSHPLRKESITCSVDGKECVDAKPSKNKDQDGEVRRNFRVRVVDGDEKTVVEAQTYKFENTKTGNRIRFTPLQVAAVRAGLSPGLSLVVGSPGSGKTDVAVQIIAGLYHSFPSQRTVIITHSNAALNDIFEKVMTRGDIEERYMVRLGAGERDLNTESTHDFTKIGRVAYSLSRRGVLLERIQLLSESLGISGRGERGEDGAPSYTCETADYFHSYHIERRRLQFESTIEEHGKTGVDDVTSFFPFVAFFKAENVTVDKAQSYFAELVDIFSELAEYRPLEMLRTQRQRSDYLIMKQARIVAMTCTHAAIARSHLIKLGFEYDNLVVEEAGQMLEIENFIPMLLQRGKHGGSTACRLKRLTLLGDHNQLPPVIQNMTLARHSNLDQSMFVRLIRMGVPSIQLDKQGRARPEIAALYSWRYHNLGNLDCVISNDIYKRANAGFQYTYQLVNVEDFDGKGESSPTSHFFQNMGEAEYVVAVFQYMVLIGYSPQRISILTTYNGQRALIRDIISQRCGDATPLAGVRPRAVSTVDQYQGQQNDIILLSLVRTESVGHLRDVRRLIVATSRARLGLYVFCRYELFNRCFELERTFQLLAKRPTNKLRLVVSEISPTQRFVEDTISKKQAFEIDDVSHMGMIVHQMQEDMMKAA